jgi:hypothetical protein
LDCPYQFCGGIISALLREIVLGVNNFGGQFPFFGGLINSHPNINSIIKRVAFISKGF